MDHTTATGQAELRAARKDSRMLYWAVGLFSFFVNLLMLTGPLYMLNVYDRVLHARSVETLVALTLLASFLYLIMFVLDITRGRIMTRVGARFQNRLDRRVYAAVLDATAKQRVPEQAATGLRDLESVQRLIASPALLAVFDLPWVPMFFFGIFVFHPLLGLVALAGALVLVGLAVLNHLTSRTPLNRANQAGHDAAQIGQQIRHETEAVQALGMRAASFHRWQRARDAALAAGVDAADVAGSLNAVTRTFRLALQSAMLGLGAYLVLQDQLSPGAMIAGSILLGRALAPVEAMIMHWALVQRGRDGWQQLAILLGQVPQRPDQIKLPRPQAKLTARQVTVIPPGESNAALRLISFDVTQGQAVGVIGPSGAGKTALARSLAGVWQPAGGTIRLDGATLDQYDPDVLGQHLGYLPQRMQLFDGTIRENIARLAAVPDDALVVQAAQKAAAHEMILKLPAGYDTKITATSVQLSGGQVQRIGLARALYGDPVMLVLDEPNANLDHDGSLALNMAIRAFKASGGIVFVMAHRPTAVQECDLLLVIDNGMRRAFGPRETVLADMVQNYGQIRGLTHPAGLA